MLPVAIDHELTREPFVPIRIHMSDGHSVIIRNPNLCLITRGTLYIAQTEPPTRLADNMNALDVRQVIRIEQIEDQPANT